MSMVSRVPFGALTAPVELPKPVTAQSSHASSASPYRHAALGRWAAAFGAIVLCAGCGSQNPPGSAGASTPAAPGQSGAIPTAGPSLTPIVSAPPASVVPSAAPAATPTVNEGFHNSDILKVEVNRLAARTAPRRSAGLVHGYSLGGPTPIDGGLIRLSKGDFVSVQLGPLKVGDTVWYLVWPADGDRLHQSGLDWYAGPPGTTAGGPAWVAASVGNDEYLTFHRRPEKAEIEEFLPIGTSAAGTGGDYESAPVPRHDFFLLDWAAAAPTSGTSCLLNVSLVPADADFEPKVGVDTSTSTVKVSSLTGKPLNTPWLPAAEGSWTSFTVQVDGTCTWAFNLSRLDHD